MTARTLEALAVVCELTGAVWSRAALEHAEQVLDDFPEPAVVAALERCAQELRGRLSLAEILERVHEQDDRPTTEQAWAIALRAMDERATVVWNNEIASAFLVASATYADGNHVGARIAFVNEYARIVKENRGQRRAAHWFPSLGHDPALRDDAVREGVARGQLTAPQALALGVACNAPDTPALDAPRYETVHRIGDLLPTKIPTS